MFKLYSLVNSEDGTEEWELLEFWCDAREAILALYESI